MFSTLALATLVATQDRPNTGFFGLATSFHWNRNMTHNATFTVNRTNEQLATVLTGLSTNRFDFANYGVPTVQLLVNGVYKNFWKQEFMGGAAGVEMRNGTYKLVMSNSASTQMETLHGYYTQRAATSTTHQDPWLTTDRLWQYFPDRDGASFNIVSPKFVMTYIGDSSLQRFTNGSWATIYNISGVAQAYPLPGVYLAPGIYRLVNAGGVNIMGGYVAP